MLEVHNRLAVRQLDAVVMVLQEPLESEEMGQTALQVVAHTPTVGAAAAAAVIMAAVVVEIAAVVLVAVAVLRTLQESPEAAQRLGFVQDMVRS